MWSHHQNPNGHISPVKGSPIEYLRYVILALIGSATLGYIMSAHTDASLPYADAFTTCASLTAQWLLSHRKLFNWLFWIIVDIVAIAIYWQKGLYPTAALYFCFLVMSSCGQYAWLRAYRRQSKEAAQNTGKKTSEKPECDTDTI